MSTFEDRERPGFEAWYSVQPHHAALGKFGDGRYQVPATDMRWETWLARAKQAEATDKLKDAVIAAAVEWYDKEGTMDCRKNLCTAILDYLAASQENSKGGGE